MAFLGLVTPVVAGVATGDERTALPDEFSAAASAAGFSFVQNKQPNPLPVGPGAFLTFDIPEVAGSLTANTATARTSFVYPGPVVAGSPALLCTAGATPFCGQAPPPVLAEAQYPQAPDATLATDGVSFRQPSVPLSAGAGSGEAHTTATSSTSKSVLAGYRLDAPDAARQAILDALTATLGSITGAKVADDPSFISVGGGVATQTIQPAGDGKVRSEASATFDDVHLLAGAVTIRSVTVSAFAVTDGDQVHDAGSRTSTAGVLVGGFPATIGPDGFAVNGSGDGGAGRQQLNGVAGRVADAVATATGKLKMQVRDGAATRDQSGGAAADGLRISLANSQLTDTSPPQVPALCSATGAVQDPLASGGLALPPICAVPDVTGTSDSYDFLLGRASVTLSAQRFGVFGSDSDLGSVGDVTGLVGSGGDTSMLADGGTGAGPVAGAPGARRSTARRSVPAPGQPGFLAFEAKWLGGAGAAQRFADVYLALVGLALVLFLTSRVAPRSARSPFRKEEP